MTKQDATTPPQLLTAELERFAAPGLVASMDATTHGAFVRLLSHAWQQEPPCSLPADDAFLAAVARTSPSEWERIKSVILLAFVPSHQLPEPDQGNRTRLVNAVARAIYDQLAAEAAAFSELQSRKSRARWSGRGRPDPDGMPPGSRRDSGGKPVASAPSLRSESPSLSLIRSSLADKSSRSSERSRSEPESDGVVIAQMGERARAIESDRIRGWRREQSLDRLQKALASWRTRGLTSCPVSKASEIADGRYSEPARVQAVLEDIEAKILEGTMRNPVAYLLCGLGLAERRGGGVRPAEIPLQLAARWAELEASKRKTFETVAAVQAIASRLKSAQPSSVAQVGGA